LYRQASQKSGCEKERKIGAVEQADQIGRTGRARQSGTAIVGHFDPRRANKVTAAYPSKKNSTRAKKESTSAYAFPGSHVFSLTKGRPAGNHGFF